MIDYLTLETQAAIILLPGPNFQFMLRNLHGGVLVEVLPAKTDQVQVLHYLLEQHVVYVNHFAELAESSEYYLQQIKIFESKTF